MCIPCDELLSTEHIIVLFFCGSDLIEARERHFTSRSVRVQFMGVSLDCTLVISRSLIISRRSTFLEGYNFVNQKINFYLYFVTEHATGLSMCVYFGVYCVPLKCFVLI